MQFEVEGLGLGLKSSSVVVVVSKDLTTGTRRAFEMIWATTTVGLNPQLVCATTFADALEATPAART